MKSWKLDGFEDIKAWLPVASGQAELKLSTAAHGTTPALRMDYDFKGGGGFVVARHQTSYHMPQDYCIRLRVRGQGSINHLEIKLIDPTNQNVWRCQHKDFQPRARWQSLTLTNRDIEFAWGPAGGGAMSEIGAIEFAIVAGEGGAGSLSISSMQIEDLSFDRKPRVTASSATRGHGPAKVVDGQPDTFWQSTASDKKPWVLLSSDEPRALGGLIIDWQHQAPARGFRVRTSMDGHRWKTRHSTTRAGGRRSYIYLPNTRACMVRLELNEPAGIKAIQVQSFEFSRSIESFWHHIASNEPRGHHPRWLMREQSLWTPIGIMSGKACPLMNEQGMIEVDEGSFSIEPIVSINGKIITWADVEISQALRHEWMPIPCVTWKARTWSLTIEAYSNEGVLHISYKIEGHAKAAKPKVYLAIRPFQVTPPWQHFRKLGGMSPIHDLSWDGECVFVNKTTQIRPLGTAKFGTLSFDEGNVVEALKASIFPTSTSLHEKLGFASGLLVFEGPHVAIEVRSPSAESSVTPTLSETEAQWASLLNACQIKGANWATDAITTMRTAAAHIISTRSNTALQPGPRRYTRSWIRDGTIMSEALLRMGCVKEVRDFIEWYAGYQRDDGFVPCCVDRDGPDWLIEHDSHGQWLTLLADYFAFTNGTNWLKKNWHSINKTMQCIVRLIEPAGLMPISASHEGYLAQPVHSFWDDFWTLRGLRAAVELAAALGHSSHAKRWNKTMAKFETSLFASIEATRTANHLDTLPASIEWADFDPTATANAVTLLDVPAQLNQTALQRTFDQYLIDWHKKRTGELKWSNYTPYEIRIIGALVRLGRRDDALELLRFFLSDRRPLAWNQWPEIAWQNPLSPGHIGDVPHTWIGAEYILSVQSLFAYEAESSQSLVLAAGLAPEWLEGDGVEVRDMPTRHGRLNYSLHRKTKSTLSFTLKTGLKMPTGGIVLRPPLQGRIISVEGEPSNEVTFDHQSVTLHEPCVRLIIKTHVR